jgi:hypothetical protein
MMNSESELCICQSNLRVSEYLWMPVFLCLFRKYFDLGIRMQYDELSNGPLFNFLLKEGQSLL